MLGIAAAAGTVHPRPAGAQKGRPSKTTGSGKPPLLLADFEPKSILHVAETKHSRPRFPVIDVHTHLCWGDVLGGEEKLEFIATPEEILPVMDRRDVRMMVTLTGGYGGGLEQAIRFWHRPHPTRFLVFTEPWYAKAGDPDYPKFQADQLEKAHSAGAKGLKLLKTLGLYLRERVHTGKLIKVDDRRFDPMWETAGRLRMPVLIHTSDPEAFFLPVDRFNERYEELSAHPDWSFYGRDYPNNKELHEARNRVIARHPRTNFILAHVGNSENLAWVGEWLNQYPNLYVDISARISELGRQPRTARRFFETYQDRILFGTDAVPHGTETPQQVFGDALYQIYYRFLETEDEYFDYAPAPVPPQGRWRIYGLGLPDSILRKVYYQNAARLLNLELDR
ncbi:MAG: amidohydrolase family protein [Bryobacteraceae bacterium]|nr:amidohydrolase family protein [Bryobacteraceae bacterium]